MRAGVDATRARALITKHLPRLLAILPWILNAWLPLLPCAFAADVQEDPFAAAVELLKDASFIKKTQAVEKLQGLNDPRTLPTLRALLQDELHYRASDKSIVIAQPRGEAFDLRDVLSGEVEHADRKDKLKKVIINNQLRLTLRGAIARLSLSHDDLSLIHI